MPDFLTRRNGTWHFVRRVPIEYAAYDLRGVIRHSTKVRVAADRTGRRATQVALRLNTRVGDLLASARRGHLRRSDDGLRPCATARPVPRL